MVYRQTTAERIDNLRRILHVHSLIYYHAHTSLITDAQFDIWTKELLNLQMLHPELAAMGYEPALFENWNGNTGMHFPLTPYAERTAHRLMRQAEERGHHAS